MTEKVINYGIESHPNSFYSRNFFPFVKEDDGDFILSPKESMIWEGGFGILQFAYEMGKTVEDKADEVAKEYHTFLVESLKIDCISLDTIKDKLMEGKAVMGLEYEEFWIEPDDEYDSKGNPNYPVKFYGTAEEAADEKLWMEEHVWS